MKRSKFFIGHHSDHMDEKINAFLSSEEVGKLLVHEIKMITDRENKIVVAVWILYEVKK